MSILTAVGAGWDKLTPAEDAMLWRMRGAGKSWIEVEEAIARYRASMKEIGRQGGERLRIAHAKMWRDRVQAARNA